jgi:hypothetical protein
MKNNFTNTLKLSGQSLHFTILVAFLFVSSCKKEYEETKTNDHLIIELKNWADNNIQTQTLTTAIFRARQSKIMSAEKGNDAQRQLMKGDSKLSLQWDDAKTYLNGNETIVEVPIKTKNIFLFNLSAPIKNEKIRKDKSLTRIVFIKNAQKTDVFFITFIFDEIYLTDSNSKPESNTHTKQQPNFSGSIIYHDINGNLMRGLFVNNSISKDKAVSAKSDPNNKLGIALPDECKEIPVYQVIGENCFDISYYYTYCQNVFSIYLGHTSCAGGGGGVNPYNPPSGGGGGGGAKPSPREIIDSVKNPCIKEQLRLALNAQTTIRNMLNETFGGLIEFESLNLTFKDVTNLPDSISGDATRASATSIYFDIRLNANKLPGYSKEYTLSTIYHEILHAYLFSKITKGPDGKYNISNQHENMANRYLILMAGALKIAYPNISEQEAWGLSWGGLEQTNFYSTKLTQSQKDLISDINRRHTNKASKDKQGTYCN